MCILSGDLSKRTVRGHRRNVQELGTLSFGFTRTVRHQQCTSIETDSYKLHVNKLKQYKLYSDMTSDLAVQEAYGL